MLNILSATDAAVWSNVKSFREVAPIIFRFAGRLFELLGKMHSLSTERWLVRVAAFLGEKRDRWSTEDAKSSATGK